MPVPKRKTSKSRRDTRQSCKFIRPVGFFACEHCASPLRSHQACDTCGYYKGVKVLLTKSERVVRRDALKLAKNAKKMADVPSGEPESSQT